MCVKLPQSCLTFCNPMDGNPPGSPVPGILQARTLEWRPKANNGQFDSAKLTSEIDPRSFRD